MRGKNKLVLHIAVVSATGMLAFTATFPQPEIIQTEGSFQTAEYGTAGIMAALLPDEQLSGILTQAITIEKNDVTIVASAADEKSDVNEKKTAEKQSAVSREKEEEEAGGAAEKNKEKTQIKTKAAKETEEETKSDKAADNNIKNKAVEETEKKTAEENETETEKKASNETKEDTEKSAKETENKTAEKTKAESKTAEKSESTEKAAESKTAEKTKAESKTAEKSESTKKAAKSKAAKTAEDTSAEEKKSEKKEAKKWAKKLMADVDDYLNIRQSASVDSDILGKLRRGDAAQIIKKGRTWTKIKSGSVTGYVKNKFCVFGKEAYKLAQKVCGTYAYVQADGLRIREEASKDALILDAAEEGDKLAVDTAAKEKDGWVAVNHNDTNAYVSEKYVKVALDTGNAISIEEEMAQIAAQREAEQQDVDTEAAQASSNSVSAGSGQTVQNSAVQVSPDDLTLLSAIIYCEAGGESYEGQVAVGAVVMNRVKSGSYPNTISGVVYQSGQFSPVSNGSLARALSNGNYQNCVSAAQEALAGADNTGGAKNFHVVNGDAGLVIGHHVFF